MATQLPSADAGERVMANNIFDTIKKGGSIIKNEEVLSYEYLPKLLPFREGQVQEIAFAIKPLMAGQRGTNLFIHGAPGIGKTASLQWVLRELKETTDEVVPIYVNCWNFKSKYFIFSDIANQLKVSFIQGRAAEHILQQINHRLRDSAAVFVFDEVDKVDDADWLYQIISTFPRSCILLVSNSQDYTAKIESRIKSRLMLKSLEFRPYNLNEIHGILKERAKLALKPEAIEPSLLKQIANVTLSKGDVRVGLHLLREAAKLAEEKSKRSIDLDSVKAALKTIEMTKIGDEEKLTADEQKILAAVKEKNGGTSGDIYGIYAKNGGQLSYRSFKRYTERMAKLEMIRLETTGGGFKGKSTLISLS